MQAGWAVLLPGQLLLHPRRLREAYRSRLLPMGPRGPVPARRCSNPHRLQLQEVQLRQGPRGRLRSGPERLILHHLPPSGQVKAWGGITLTYSFHWPVKRWRGNTVTDSFHWLVKRWRGNTATDSFHWLVKRWRGNTATVKWIRWRGNTATDSFCWPVRNLATDSLYWPVKRSLWTTVTDSFYWPVKRDEELGEIVLLASRARQRITLTCFTGEWN